MPNRIIKESICTSDTIDALSWFEEVLFYRLIVNCDDHGCFDGRIKVIQNRLFPLKENVTTKSVEAAISKLASVELVVLYEFEGKPYLHLPSWDSHQQVRARRRKYPDPAIACKNMISNDIKCNQTQADDSICTRNPIQSESESKSEAENAREATAVVCDAEKPDFGTLEAYASSNLTVLSPRNMEDLLAFREEMDEDVIRHAIDEACAAGRRNWSYARAILRRFLESGMKTMGDVKAAESQRAANGKNTAAKGFQQHSYTENDFGTGFFYDPTADYGK
jgi:DnaD/phage-associated family protein